jgi:hypothetical protein
LQLVLDYATAGSLAAIIGWGTNTPALGTFHFDAAATLLSLLLLSPIYLLDVAMMIPDFQTAATLRSPAELAAGGARFTTAPTAPDSQRRQIVFESWTAYYRFLLDGNQVDCIVNDPCINVPMKPRLVLVAPSALSEEMLFRGVLVMLMGKGFKLAILQVRIGPTAALKGG